MIEILLVLIAVGALSGSALAALWVAPELLLQAGATVVALGLAVGVPTGLWYHVALYRALRLRGPLPARWWLRPVLLHEALLPNERPGVLRWFVVGGAGCLVVVLGCCVVGLGVLSVLLVAES